MFLKASTFAGVIYERLGTFPSQSYPAPYGNMLQGSDGAFYGTTYLGGTNINDYGTVFRATTDGNISVLHTFSLSTASSDGTQPNAGLFQTVDGLLYGTTVMGGSGWGGTVFCIQTNGTFSTIAAFSSNVTGRSPDSALIQGCDGNLYGTTDNSLYRLSTNGVLTCVVMFPFDNNTSTYPKGAGSHGIVLGKDGAFYGTAASGGDYNKGTIFKVTTNGGMSVLFSFDGSNGWYCNAPLIQGMDGNYYGTTVAGGLNTNQNYYAPQVSYGYGTIFRITPAGDFTRLFSFDGTNGVGPCAGVIQAIDGNLYGITEASTMLPPSGTIFQLTTNGIFTTLWAFSSEFGDGLSGGLTQGTDGRLYCMSFGGVFFRLSVPMTPSVQSLGKSGDIISISWKSVAGQTYRIQNASEPTSTNWTSITGTLTATDGVMSRTVQTSGASQQFYRVVLLP
jgi:uncharacterized repeat protein (TIGR03803 family)